MTRFTELSSLELIKICADSNDERAWTEFIRRFHSVIAAAVLKTSRQWVDPTQSQLDDLIQDTYLKLCESDNRLLRTFESRHENSFYGFLKVVTANVVHDHFKSLTAMKRGVANTEPLTEPSLLDEKTLSSQGLDIMQRLQVEQIDRILRQVTSGKDQDRNRIIFWLRHRNGMTASEIASIPTFELTTEGVESVLLRLTAAICKYLESSSPHRKVKVFPRKNRSKRSRG